MVRSQKEEARIPPKILVIDIETRPAVVYTWGLHDVNISIDQIISPSRPICFAAKFVGDKTVHFHADWIDGHDEMIRRAHELISEADAVVGYNHDKFDLPKLQGEFLLGGLPPPPPPTTIDIWKTVKKLGFQSTKLGYVGPLLQVGRKIKNAGFSLWVGVENGDERCQRQMRGYCIGDTRLTERVYKKLQPYILNHPYLSDVKSEACASCGSHHLQSRGTRRTRYYAIQRLQCQSCGAWQTGTRYKIPAAKGK